MMLDVPFKPMEIPNYCGQFVLNLAFQYLLNKEMDLEELSTLTDKFENGVTFSTGLAYAALKQGLNAKLITTDDWLKNNNGDGIEQNTLEKMYNNEGMDEIKKRSKEISDKAVEEGLIFEFRKPTFEDLYTNMDKNNMIINIIDCGKIYGVERQIFHFVLLTGYDNENIYYHDVGPNNPTANKKIDKETFYKAWSAPCTDMDTLIISK